MGCDIHLWIEYSPYATTDGEPSWYSYVENYNPGRDYHIFCIMADCGRNDGDVEQLYQNRGVPEGKLSWSAKDMLAGEDNDLHGHSWLTADEYAHCLGTRMLTNEWGPPDVGWDVLLVSMKAFEERGIKTRLIFAFDN
jgi:hypothetical protein